MRVLKKQFIINAAGLWLLLAGCTQDSFYGGCPGKEEQSLTFTFRIDGMTTNSATRATVSPIEGETTIASLHLLFFNARDDRSGTLAGTVSLAGDGEGRGNPGTVGKLTMETSYVLPETGAGNIDPDQAYHIIGVANLGDYADAGEWLSRWVGQTETFFRDNATLEAAGTNDEGDYGTHRPIKKSALPMNGYTDKPAGTKNIQMTLTRNVSRFDVENAASTHTLKTASVWNAFTRMSVTGDAPFDYAPAAHTKRFYGIQCPDSPGNVVTGGLYAFANYSETPGASDKTTTCLIAGLAPTGGGATRYYRINIHSAGAAQHLKDNYAYNITILSVTGEGYPTENEAWEGTANQLVYAVNNWDLDDNGLIVSDEFSILAVPVKTVKVGSPGGEFSYSITTFSTLENPGPPCIKSQLYDPADGNITARVSNGNLIIEAEPMNTGEERRTGIIIVSFAGLEATVNVLQAAAGDTFLEITLDDEWKECLPPTANAMSEYIHVNASGPWTARLYGSPNFTFRNSLGNDMTKITSAECPNNKFHVYTSVANESKTESRKGFALISLDSDPANYIAVAPLCQLPKGGIDTDPAELETIEFEGNRKLKLPAPVVPGTTGYSFAVESQTGIISADGIRLVGLNHDKFEYAYIPHGSDPAKGTMTVRARGLNSTNTPYMATILVNDNKNGVLMVNLIQHPLQLTVIPPAEWIPVTGGVSNEIAVSIEDPDARWTATVNVTAKSGGLRALIYNHPAEILKADGMPLGAGEYTDMNLKVRLPKVYYPNRGTDIEAVVTVTTSDGISASCPVYQQRLNGRTNLTALASGDGYGTIGQGSSVFANFKTDYIYLVTNAITNYDRNNPSHIFGEYNFINFNNNASAANSPLNNILNYDWSGMDTWVNGDYGILMVTGDVVSSQNFQNSMAHGNSPFGPGFAIAGSISGSAAPYVNTAAAGRRVYQFIMDRLPTAVVTPCGTFVIDGTRTEAIAWPSEAVPMILYNNNANRALMTIDPKRRTIYIGDGQMFQTVSGNQQAFMRNVLAYIKLGMQYGSHFTDMLIDPPNDVVPAPWDGLWQGNKWPD